MRCLFSTLQKQTMPRKDNESIQRKRGKDKAKDRYNKFGKYSNKNVRYQEKQISQLHTTQKTDDKNEKSK